MKLRSSFVAAALLVLAPALALAQTAQTGTLSGVARDGSGGILPGVEVTVVSQERGTVRTTVTDAKGRYVFPGLSLGLYKVTAAMSGMETLNVSDNLVEAERTTSVPLALRIAGVTETVQVTGETPIVDITNTSVTTRVSKDEYDKIPIGRNYQTMLARAPGVVGTGNVNSSGALTSSNLFLMDGIDTTDPTTGTFGTNLNFEAIQEVSVSTSSVSAEYGRGVGAVVNVITRSGTNRFEGSAKYIIVNDDWNAQNNTKSETTGDSLARVKFDKVNPVYSFTLGGPILKDRAWFFGAYEQSKNTSPQRQTVGVIPEDFQQTTTSNFWNVRLTAQVANNHSVWVKYFESPTDGFVIDYWGAAAERTALTAQDQSADNWAAQWTGILSSNWTMEAMFGSYGSLITVGTFEDGRHSNGAPHFSFADSKYYNGATFDGFVERPRKQFNLASTWFTSIGGHSHSLKAGLDFQDVESGAEFKYPNQQLFLDASFDQRTGLFVPQNRRDYEAGPSVSTGRTYAFYVRDKFELGERLFVEAGLRLEKQTGTSDVDATTVDTTALSPRLSAGYDLAGDGKTLIVASYGRFYSGIIQGFSDAFANIPQQANYKNYAWDGQAFVFQNEVRVGASSFKPNTNLDPSYVDDLTLGFQRQFGRNMGAGVRFVARNWGNLIDDTRRFNADGTIQRDVVNYGPAERQYRGIQFTFDRRFSGGWSTQASYTWSKTEGNHFAGTFSALGDYLDAQCRTTVDTTIGAAGVISCAEVQDGPTVNGRPAYDRPHNLKLSAAYQRRLGPVSLTLGALSDAISKATYTKNRTLNVLRPGTLTNAGPTAVYLYEPLGSDRIDGIAWFLDTSLEVTWQFVSRAQAGLRAELFNITNEQEKIAVNNSVWCNTTATAACATAVERYGTATARGSFQAPRSVRFSAIVRF